MSVVVNSEPFKGWKGVLGLIIGVFLVSLGLMPQTFSTSKIFLGVVCVFISGVKKTVSLDESGLTERISVWGIRKEKKSQWASVESVDVETKEGNCVISTQVSGKNYKFPSDESSASAIKEIFYRSHPDLQV